MFGELFCFQAQDGDAITAITFVVASVFYLLITTACRYRLPMSADEHQMIDHAAGPGLDDDEASLTA